jgi:hypothetical protein
MSWDVEDLADSPSSQLKSEWVELELRDFVFTDAIINFLVLKMAAYLKLVNVAENTYIKKNDKKFFDPLQPW